MSTPPRDVSLFSVLPLSPNGSIATPDNAALVGEEGGRESLRAHSESANHAKGVSGGGIACKEKGKVFFRVYSSIPARTMT